MLTGTMTRDEIERALSQVGRHDDGNFDIAEAALLLAALDRPDAELAVYRDYLAGLAGAVGLRDATNLDDRIAVLNDVILGDHGYCGDVDTYEDMRNANLMDVIDRRLGLPVALGVLYIHAARAQDWTIEGVNFPTHFLIRMSSPDVDAVIDPFNGGIRLEDDDLAAMLGAEPDDDIEFMAEWERAVSDREILLRLQNNIKIRAIEADDPERALATLRGMTLIAPDIGVLWCETALIHSEMGSFKRAIGILDDFLDTAPDDAERDIVEDLRSSLRTSLN